MNPQIPNQQTPTDQNLSLPPPPAGSALDGVLPPNPAAPLNNTASASPLPPATNPYASPIPTNTALPSQLNQAPGGHTAPVPPIPPKVNPNSTQNTLQVAEIRDGIIIMNDGSFRSIVMLKSINFDLMSQQEREAVEYSYQGFLNSLYFPVQIFIRSQKVDLRPYIERLDKIRSEHDNMLLAMLMEDYIGFIDNLSLQTNIMDKKFYIVIPYYPILVDLQKPIEASKGLFKGVAGLFSSKQEHVTINEVDLEKGKAELRNRVQAVLSGLLQCGVQGLPLATQELIELLYDTYNPDTATRQELKNFNDLTAPMITKGQGNAAQPNLDREMTP